MFAAQDFSGILPVIVVALVFVFRALAMARRKGRDGSRLAPGGYQPPSRPRSIPAPDSAEEAERTRRVQEEVRRRIAERQGGHPPVLPSPPPVAPGPGSLLRELLEPEPEPEPSAPTAEDAAAELERQRRMERDLQALEAARAAKAAKSALAARADEAPARSGGANWLSELRGAGGARRAIVLREIIGPPLALRR